jgi:NADH:ubiquinone oxidoreductase subunit 6 (subunit J)
MILLDFYFLGLTYIIVYVGAIMILFLFVIMMVQIHLIPSNELLAPRVGMTTTQNLFFGHDMHYGNGQLALLLNSSRPVS